MSPFLSVIIPTHNRIDMLLCTVDALLRQSEDANEQVEIIIVDDGSSLEVRSPLSDLATRCGKPNMLRYFFQQARGPAAARNLGIQEARGDVVLFLGDDILARPGLLRVHISAHTEEYPEKNYAVLGLADLAPWLCKTPFVNWWRRWNFRYRLLLEHRRRPDYSFFYTNNLSLKRDFLLQYGLFDESFRYAAYEDGELGYRLSKNGLELVFKPEACADHVHRIDLLLACQRMMVRGKAFDLFVQKTGTPGISQIWKLLGTGPWMVPPLIRPLFRLADWLQTRGVIGPIYILVLMYAFQVGRGRCVPISEMTAN